MEINSRDFFKAPFTAEEIKALLNGQPAAEIFNFRSPSYKALGLDAARLNSDDLIKLMLKEPRLIRRPVVKMGGNTYFGADSKMLAELTGKE